MMVVLIGMVGVLIKINTILGVIGQRLYTNYRVEVGREIVLFTGRACMVYVDEHVSSAGNGALVVFDQYKSTTLINGYNNSGNFYNDASQMTTLGLYKNGLGQLVLKNGYQTQRVINVVLFNLVTDANV